MRGVSLTFDGLKIQGFSRAGDQPVFLPLQFHIAVPNWMVADRTPNIYHLVELGYGLIAVPTGVFSVELALQARASRVSTRACLTCSLEGHDPDAKFCKSCGAELE